MNILRRFQTTAAREAYRFDANAVGRLVYDVEDTITYLVYAEGLGADVLFPLDPSAMGGGAGFDPAYYTGYSTTSGYTWDSTTWSDVHNKLTITDVDQVGITRSDSDFTIAETGIYVVDFAAMGHNTAGDDFLAIRLRRSSTTLAQFQAHANANARTVMARLHTVVSCNAADVLKIQYQVTATYSAYTPATADGETPRVAQINIYRIS